MSRAERLKWDRIYGSAERVHGTEPSPFLVESVAALAPGRALVLAMGEGRNAAFLARLGFEVEGIDISLAAARKACDRVRSEGGSLRAVVADLSEYPLPAGRYDLVCVLNFLDRTLFASVARSLRPGGAVVWETFTRAHARLGSPRNPAYLLDPGELRTRFAALAIERYREVVVESAGKRSAVASLFAKRRLEGS
jgi:SAM-dependent methyltransferase